MRTTAIIAPLLATAVLSLSGAAGAATTVCGVTDLPPVLAGNVLVPADTYCVIDGVSISGNVTVQPGGKITIRASSSDTRIGGNVRATGCDFAEVLNSAGSHRIVIGGHVSIRGCTGIVSSGCDGSSTAAPPGSVLIGGNFTCAESAAANCVLDSCTVAGNVDCSRNDPGCFILSSSIGGSVKANDNAPGGLLLNDNLVGGDVKCDGNAGIGGGGNTAGGTKSGQCLGL